MVLSKEGEREHGKRRTRTCLPPLLPQILELVRCQEPLHRRAFSNAQGGDGEFTQSTLFEIHLQAIITADHKRDEAAQVGLVPDDKDPVFLPASGQALTDEHLPVAVGLQAWGVFIEISGCKIPRAVSAVCFVRTRGLEKTRSKESCIARIPFAICACPWSLWG